MSTVELPISGMTCASCANRVERRLNELDGVAATTTDGFVRDASVRGARDQRRFVRMLVLERGSYRVFVITPPAYSYTAEKWS